ncbi:hypothetical protein [Spiroplasma endosymbiont of Stenodema calcarata]|uniref:hypothetical protein n=1 Tax=Spiroplasma endosymbiont of Stenodema calcarata TaxID=3139328 RepID=UPI003CCB0AF1
MIYTEADLIKQPIIPIEMELIINDNLLSYSPNIRALKNVRIEGKLQYHSNLNIVNIVATIKGKIIVEDARTLEHFEVAINLEWNDEYSFKFFKKSDINFNFVENSWYL